MADFLVTFFSGRSKVTCRLSELVKKQRNRLLLDDLGIPEGIELYFSQENQNGSFIYTIDQGRGQRYEVLLYEKICTGHILQNRDYITFKNSKDNRIVKALFISLSDIKIGYKKYKLEKDTNIFIGRTPANDISFNFSHSISREKHAAIRVDGNGNAFIEDLKRTAGIYVNGRLTYSQKLQRFDEIFFMGLSIIYMGEFIAVRNLELQSTLQTMTEFTVKAPPEDIEEKKYFVSTPRILKSLDTDVIEIDPPPNPSVMDKTPAILTVGPSLTMSMVMLVSLSISLTKAITGGDLTTIITSGTMAAGMLMGSLMWPALLRSYQKRTVIAQEKYRKSKYSSYIAGIEEELEEKRSRAIRILNDTLSPAPEILCSMLDDERSKLRLWERSSEDNDFLAVRIGRGKRPFDVQLKIPKSGFSLYTDEMCSLPDRLLEKYGILEDVPLTLDICRNRTVGIIGKQANVRTLINQIIVNIIALHSSDEVKVVLVMPSKQISDYAMFKNVPHIWSNDKKTRYFAANPDEVHLVFNAIDELVKEREETDNKRIIRIPHYVIIVTEPSMIEKEALLRYMNDAENRVGITTIFAYGSVAKLPKFCRTIIQSDETRTGYYIKNQNENRFVPFISDCVEESKIQKFAEQLSQLAVKYDSRTLGIVDRISFLQMYKAGNVAELQIEQRWNHNDSEKSLAAPIGVMAGGEVFCLDIHEAYHGCHGLVAGTTGSGKSEFLQAFVLSLAINYSPREVAFVLVDFKGGDMARPFMERKHTPALPHLSATISNLSGNILYRALVSFGAEIKFRQCLMNEAAGMLGVDKLDINSYHKYYKSGRLETPLPHLIIVIDEFAQLKTQNPEFLTQLINVAQVGRSLGIHLILATQKPGGIVDPQIMSNSRFKICLKVADKQDSVEMLNKPDSAMIKNPGRLHLQVGYDEIYECIQSGYSGADYVPAKRYMPEDEITVQMTDNTANPIHSAKLDLSGKKTDRTQLEAVVTEIVKIGQKKQIAARQLWLAVLPDKVFLESLAKTEKGVCTATIGLLDHIRMQQQMPFTLDFSKTGHIALYGASGTGKTTFLQSLIYSMVCMYRYTPDELNIYAMDFGGRNLGYLSRLPHVGGVVFADDQDKVLELESVLSAIVEERKRLFAAENCSTFVEYWSGGKKILPAVLVLIDHFSAFHERYTDVAYRFVSIIASGKTYGVYFAITGNTRNAIYYKVTEHISTYFMLRMNDPHSYLDILNVRPPIIPEAVSGRGITVIDREVVEFQTALALESETEAERIQSISQVYENITLSWNGSLPIRLGEEVEIVQSSLQESIIATYSQSRTDIPEEIDDTQEHVILGSSRSGALQYGIKLEADYKICVCADSRDEMMTCYGRMLKNIGAYSNRKLVVIDNDQGTFGSLRDQCSFFRYVKGMDELDGFIEELKPELNARLKGNWTEELFIVITEFNAFFDMISDSQAVFMRKVFQYIDSPQYGICFICGFDVNGNKNNDRLFMSLVVKAENYLICSNSYEKAVSRIETMPMISEVKMDGCYLVLKDKYVEVRR